jgi:hypothetical protein
MEDLALQPDADKPTNVVGLKTGFKNQSNIKAAARGIVLEALTAFKGGKVGKRGLLVKAMTRLERALESQDPEESRWGAEQVLKLANGMTKDDKAGQTLTDLLQAGNVQINFNSYFEARQSLPGQSLTIGHSRPGFTPPPRSGE